MKAWQALRRALDRATLYLPLGVMALLAMGSWWLVRSMPELWRAPLAPTARTAPDYHFARFTTETFDAQGQRTHRLSGDEARHYPDSDELHIDRVRLASRNAAGQELLAEAQRGIVTGDGERVTLIEQVVLVRPALGQAPRLELRGEQVVALQKEQRLLSERPVQLLRGTDRFSAQTMDVNLQSGQHRLSGRVRGELQPRPAR